MRAGRARGADIFDRDIWEEASAFAVIASGFRTGDCAAFFGAGLSTRGFATGLVGATAAGAGRRTFDAGRVDFGAADFFAARAARGSGLRLGFSFFTAAMAFAAALGAGLRGRVADFAALRPDAADGAEALIRVNCRFLDHFYALTVHPSFGRYRGAMVADEAATGNRRSTTSALFDVAP